MSPDEVRIIDRLQEWRKSCMINSYHHEIAAKKTKLVKNAFIITALSLGVISSIVGMANFKNEQTQSDNTIQQYISSCLTIISTGCMAFYNQQKYPERVHDHNLFSSQYHKLAREINTEICLKETGENQYSNLGEFMKYIKAKIDSMNDSEPSICGKIKAMRPRRTSQDSSGENQDKEQSLV